MTGGWGGSSLYYFIAECWSVGQCPGDMESAGKMMGTPPPDTCEPQLRPSTLIDTNSHRKTSAIIDARLSVLKQ